MTLLGLDFDNTLVEYDNVFHQLATEKKLIDQSISPTKTAIRNHLRQKGLDQQFTLLQAEAYGPRILDAKPAPGMLEALKLLSKQGILMTLISHKTKTPYAGPAYHLREHAKEWLEQYGFFKQPFCWNTDNIHFAETKEEKIQTIVKLKCKYYVDDLPEIIKLLPSKIHRIHYSPSKSKATSSALQMRHWKELPALIQKIHAEQQ